MTMTSKHSRMTSQASESRQPWRLDKQGFDALLDALAAVSKNRDDASRRYSALRGRLSRFFEWNGADQPDELADQTLDRLARRISTQDGSLGEVILDPEKYAVGIARLVLRETWRRQQRAERVLAVVSMNLEAQGQRDSARIEALAALLDECLMALPPESRSMIERYYCAEGDNQIEARQRLAAELGISNNALRNRAMRIRAELEESARARQSRIDRM